MMYIFIRCYIMWGGKVWIIHPVNKGLLTGSQQQLGCEFIFYLKLIWILCKWKKNFNQL